MLGHHPVQELRRLHPHETPAPFPVWVHIFTEEKYAQTVNVGPVLGSSTVTNDSRRMNIDIRFDLGCKLVHGSAGEYEHTFGGDFGYVGRIPEGCSGPVHLLYRLDLSDPVLPLNVVESEFRFLPLLFAFGYDASPMLYRARSDTEVEIYSVESSEFSRDCPYQGFPQHFDAASVNAQPITYEDQRDLLMVWFVHMHPEVYEAIPQAEIARLKRLGYPTPRVGQVHDLLQLPRGEPCPNPACENYGERYSLRPLVTIPRSPRPGLDLWPDDGPTVQIVYEICTRCGSVHTYATYD